MDVVLASSKKRYYFWLGLGVILLGLGLAAGLDAMRIGYANAYGITRHIPWGLLISGYIFFVVTSTGLCIVSSIGDVFGFKNFIPIAKRAVFLSIVSILSGFMVIFFELDHPFRMLIYNIITPNLESNIWWMGTLYGIYLIFMVIEFIFLSIGKPRMAALAGLAGLIVGISAHSNLGAVFGTLPSRPFWYGPYIPIYFIASALMSGCAAIIFFTWFALKIRNESVDEEMKQSIESVSKLSVLAISIMLFFYSWEIITGITGGESHKVAVLSMLSGPYAFQFWFFIVLTGMVLPLILFIYTKGKNINISFLASTMMLIGIFFMRYDLVLIGQIVPLYHDLGVMGLHKYQPSIFEIAIFIGGLGLLLVGFVLGEIIFKGHRSEVH
jgi:Ni/Fe-hydrogenase subunit HybB-like protein